MGNAMTEAHRWMDKEEASERKRIQITGAGLKTYWYADHIGDVFEYAYTDKEDGYRVENITGKGYGGWVRFEDAREFPVDEAELVVPCVLPTDPTTRKGIPVWSGFVEYFPVAMAAVAQLSKIANDQHNPGEPLHWAKGKSMDHMDCFMRHGIDAITNDERDTDGVLHAVKKAWRAMADLQTMADNGVDIFAVVKDADETS